MSSAKAEQFADLIRWACGRMKRLSQDLDLPAAWWNSAPGRA
ncbi:hypothetical protein [Actinacidiphila paucisporea]|nr:hypothetical protein [Actinacidiphila paucisporea]